MNCFLNEDDVVEDFPSLDESSLILSDNSGQNSFYPGGNDFSDDLIASVA